MVSYREVSLVAMSCNNNGTVHNIYGSFAIIFSFQKKNSTEMTIQLLRILNDDQIELGNSST